MDASGDCDDSSSSELSPSIRSCRFLYKAFDAEEWEELLRIEKEPEGVARRFWNQPRGVAIDTTRRMLFQTASQLGEYLEILDADRIQQLKPPVEEWRIIILDRQRGLIEGGPNKLTIEERVEFVRYGENGDTVPLEEGDSEEHAFVVIWGWLDTLTEVRKGIIFRDEVGNWDTKELAW